MLLSETPSSAPPIPRLLGAQLRRTKGAVGRHCNDLGEAIQKPSSGAETQQGQAGGEALEKGSTGPPRPPGVFLWSRFLIWSTL